jgi:integrase
VRLPLGSFHPKGSPHGLTVEEARVRAHELSRRFKDGDTDLRKAIADEKRVEKARKDEEQAQLIARNKALADRLALRQLFEQWQAIELMPRQRGDGTRIGRKDGGGFAKSQFERRLFPEYGDLPVEELTLPRLMSVIDKAKSENKLRTANVLLADLKQMLQFAVRRGHIRENPLATVTKRDAGGPDVARDRVLEPDELRLLFELLPGAGLPIRSQVAVSLLLATGVRVSELMTARWKDVSFDLRSWKIETTKSQRAHVVPLSDLSLSLFKRLHEVSRSEWVMPNKDGNGPLHVKTLGKQIADRQIGDGRPLAGRSKNTSALCLPGGRWTPHDLRRTMATRMGDLGVSTDVIEECLNHALPGRTTKVYMRSRRIDQQRAAFALIGHYLENIFGSQGTVSPKSVVELSAKRSIDN